MTQVDPEAERRPRTSELLAQLANDARSEHVTLGELVDLISQRAFGFLLIIVTLFTFIPLPVGVGAAVGLLASFLGAQMVIGLEHPWLPKWLRAKGMKREGMRKFIERLGRLMAKVERLCKPRWLPLTIGFGERVSGLLMVIVGIEMSLPIPFTNYPIAVVMLAMGVALTERDGVILSICWVSIAAMAVAAIGLGDVIFNSVRGWLA